MDDSQVLRGHVRDLWRRTFQNDYMTSTEFLSLSEQNDAYLVLREERVPMKSGKGAFGFWEGGIPEADRKVLIFGPSYLSEEDLRTEVASGESVIVCLRVKPVNGKFSDELTHRDYLGALMHMGIKRGQIGDILLSEEGAFVFVLRDIAEVICDELVRIKHTTVSAEVVTPGECTAGIKKEERNGSVASSRIDSVIAMAFHLSRGVASQLIESEKVYVNGRTVTSPSYTLKASERVSVRGYGKFEFLGAEGTTRKGRTIAKILMYV